MSQTAARPRTLRSAARLERVRKHGFYASTFTAQELRYLEQEPDPLAELKLLRTKILRLARLTPLKTASPKELEALIKLVRVVAALDALERTGVMRSKVEGALDPALAALADMEDDAL